MFKVAIGQSIDPLEKNAVREVLAKINAILGKTMPQAGILFCPEAYKHKLVLSSIREAYPGLELIGCTTDGTISSDGGYEADALVLMTFATDLGEIKAGKGTASEDTDFEVGLSAASMARDKLENTKGEMRFAIMLMDALNAGVSEVNMGIEKILGTGFPLIGGAAAAHSKKRQTYQFYNDEILTHSLVLLLFTGKIGFSCGIQGGHWPMAEKVRVTSSRKNILYTIENKPALNYFQKYIGKDSSLFINYCLAVYEEDRAGYYVRSAPFCNPEEGSITLNGVIAEKASIQLGTADKTSCLQSCNASIKNALTHSRDRIVAAVFFSCAGRKIMQGSKVVQEDNTVKKFFGSLPYIGFYGYGEFGPLNPGESSMFHGTTFVSLLITSPE